MKAQKKYKVGFEKDLHRLPGQSVDEKLQTYIEDSVDVWLVQITLGIFLIVMSWGASFVGVPNPYVITFSTIPFILYALYRLRGARERIRRLKQGRDGERYVGQLLEEMRSSGNLIYHDIFCDSFNIDHVVIGPKGIFAIETKTWSKLKGGEITYDGSNLLINGSIPDKSPIKQAQANARWLSNMIKESTGKAFPVQAIITVPSWFVQSEMQTLLKKEKVSLLNPKNLSSFIKKSKGSLSNEDIHLTSYHLSRHIKAGNQ